jgi:hypothetical protein
MDVAGAFGAARRHSSVDSPFTSGTVVRTVFGDTSSGKNLKIENRLILWQRIRDPQSTFTFLETRRPMAMAA